MKNLSKISQILLIITFLLGSIFLPNFSYASDLVIQNLTVTNTKDDEVMINWSTNLPSFYLIEYGPTNQYGTQIKGTKAGFTHAVKLSGLQAKTTYHFRIIAHTSDDKRTYTFDQTFKTKKLIDKDKPELLEFHNPLTTDKTSYIYFKTNEPVSATLTYWEENRPNKIRSIKKNSNSQKYTNIILTGLKYNTTYIYKITIKDKSNNAIKLTEKSFRTESSTFQFNDFSISRIEPIDIKSPLIKETKFTAKITTTRPAVCTLHIGKRSIKTPYFFQWNHELIVDKLKPNQSYSYYVKCRDYLKKYFTSKKFNIKTKGPIILGYSADEPQKPFGGKKFSLVKTNNSPRVYALIAKQKYYIKNPEILKSYNLNLSDIKIISEEKLAKYPDAKTIIRTATGERYFLYLDKNMKKQLLTSKVDSSYSYNKKYEAIYINEKDFHDYQDLWLIKTPDSPTVYVIRDGVKRPIYSWDVFIKNNWKPWQIGLVNQTDLDSYIAGSIIY